MKGSRHIATVLPNLKEDSKQMSFKHSLAVLGTFVSMVACHASFQAGGGSTPSASPASGGAPATTTTVPTAAPTSTDATAGGAPAATTAEPVAKAKSTIAGGKITPQGALAFDSGKAILLSNAENDALLDDLKLVLDQNPTITQMRIEGYADGGAAEANLELSGQRALAVKKALVDKGIASERLIAVGFGDKKPKTGQNQRIEFKVAVLNGKNYLNQEPTAGGKKFE